MWSAAARTGDPTPNREFSYSLVVLEPELAMLRHSAQNQVYGTDKDVTVVDIIQGELSDANKSGLQHGLQTGWLGRSSPTC